MNTFCIYTDSNAFDLMFIPNKTQKKKNPIQIMKYKVLMKKYNKEQI